VLAALLFFVRLRCPLQEPQEARYAEIPREMLAESQFIVPVLQGQPYYDKPPLLYWLVMVSYSLFGVHDWAARLVPSTAALLCVLVTYGWGRRMLGAPAALAAAVILCLSARFVQLGRLLTMDGLLCCCVVTAWGAAHVAVSEGRFRRSWWLASAAACGLGLLTKGPVAAVLVGVPVLGYLWTDCRAARPSFRMGMAYVAVAAAVSAPWFAALAISDPGFLWHFFWVHHVERFLVPFDHAEPFWFYLPELLLGMLPWTLLLPALVGFLVRRPWLLGTRGSRPVTFFLLASLWSLLFFSLSGCKRPSYILPAMPPLALALGWYVVTGLSRRWQISWAWCGVASFGVLFAAVFVVFPHYAREYSLRGQVRRHADMQVPVMCYPRGWDSISFYLGRSDVRVYPREELTALLDDLQRQPETLVFLKPSRAGQSLSDLLQRLPPALQFVPRGRQGALTVGSVIRKTR